MRQDSRELIATSDDLVGSDIGKDLFVGLSGQLIICPVLAC